MEATAPGRNRTGIANAPDEVKLMQDAVAEFSPQQPINTLHIDAERQFYIAAAERLGSIPPPNDAPANRAKGKTKAAAHVMAVFLDKLGERIAFERTGTRLYDALITKYLALSNAYGPQLTSNGQDPQGDGDVPTFDPALETLQKIRRDELSHFHLLCDCVTALGGDPTAQTPCADVTAAASMGIMQVITDPRTTLAQCLNTILSAELTDHAGWELLIDLANEATQEKMAAQFARALESEAEHLATVRGWLESLLKNDVASPAV